MQARTKTQLRQTASGENSRCGKEKWRTDFSCGSFLQETTSISTTPETNFFTYMCVCACVRCIHFRNGKNHVFSLIKTTQKIYSYVCIFLVSIRFSVTLSVSLSCCCFFSGTVHFRSFCLFFLSSPPLYPLSILIYEKKSGEAEREGERKKRRKSVFSLRAASEARNLIKTNSQ